MEFFLIAIFLSIFRGGFQRIFQKQFRAVLHFLANSTEVWAIMNDKLLTIYYFIRVYLIFLISTIEDIRKGRFMSCSTPNSLLIRLQIKDIVSSYPPLSMKNEILRLCKRVHLLRIAQRFGSFSYMYVRFTYLLKSQICKQMLTFYFFFSNLFGFTTHCQKRY